MISHSVHLVEQPWPRPWPIPGQGYTWAAPQLGPRNFGKLIGRSALVTITSGVILCLLGTLICRQFDFSWMESGVIGVSLMFSSTIIGIKLLPTTMLHQIIAKCLSYTILLLCLA